MKTKLGITTGALAAITYIASAFAGYTALILVAGYILLAENDEWLRRMAVKALAFTVAVSLISFAVSLIPSLFELINDVLYLFDAKEPLYIEFINELVILIQDIISVGKSVILVLLGIKAFKKSTIYIPGVDTLVNKIMG